MTDNRLKIFEHREFGKLTVIEKDGEFFFITNEVANMLGYANPRKAAYDHVEAEDKGVTKWNTLGGIQNVSIINESGLYSLILSSKLQQAKRFKYWVTKEVLPSIRKYGGYIKNQENSSNEEILANALILAEKVIAEKNSHIQKLSSKAEYFDKLVDSNLLTNFRNTAKELGIPQNTFIQFLIDEGLIYRDRKKKLLPYADRNKGYFEVKEWTNEDGSISGIQTFITPKGRHYFLILLGGDIDIHE